MSPQRDTAYLRFIRSLPCCACGSKFRIEAHHTGPHGLSQKSSDRSAIPLCFKHHDRRQTWSIHKLGPARFQETFGIDIAEIVKRLSSKPSIYLDAGYFVGKVEGTEYTLGPIVIGLPRAVRKILDLRREALTEAS